MGPGHREEVSEPVLRPSHPQHALMRNGGCHLDFSKECGWRDSKVWVP